MAFLNNFFIFMFFISTIFIRNVNCMDIKEIYEQINIPFDIDQHLNLSLTLIRNDSSMICSFITCNDPIPRDSCPEGTLYMEGVAQFGCCGGCVLFKSEGNSCTGSIDPFYGGGYGYESSLLSVSTSSVEPPLSENRNVISSYWCDYFLGCSDPQKTCARDPNNGGCRYVQLAYDDYVAQDYVNYRDEYLWRPQCDSRGNYLPKQCKGSMSEVQTCVCVDPDGNTLYGKAFQWQTEIYNDMNCLCSRQIWEMQQAGVDIITIHCKENGNFDPLQCIEGWCFCVNDTTGERMSPDVPELSINLLPCYNETTEGSEYWRRCDSEYHAHQLLVKSLNGHGVRQGPTTLLSCDPDGSYSGRQCKSSNCQCVDKYGARLTSPSPLGTNCNCARDQTTYGQQAFELQCALATAPGQYAVDQQVNVLIFCVDLDGVRTSPKVRQECLEYLSCPNAVLCQASPSAKECNQVCVGCPDNAYFFSDSFIETGLCVS